MLSWQPSQLLFAGGNKQAPCWKNVQLLPKNLLNVFVFKAVFKKTTTIQQKQPPNPMNNNNNQPTSQQRTKQGTLFSQSNRKQTWGHFVPELSRDNELIAPSPWGECLLTQVDSASRQHSAIDLMSRVQTVGFVFFFPPSLKLTALIFGYRHTRTRLYHRNTSSVSIYFTLIYIYTGHNKKAITQQFSELLPSFKNNACNYKGEVETPY